VDSLVQVGSWSWDPAWDEELRVGTCLGQHYNATWCAVEYYESSGAILKLLLDKAPWLLESPNKGRNLLCHAILCQNPNAVRLLLLGGANPRFPIMREGSHVSYPIHLASRLGYTQVLKQMMLPGAEVNVKTSTGDTPLMLSARAGHSDCFLELIKFGADLGIANNEGETAITIANLSSFRSSIVDILMRALNCGARLVSSDMTVFSPLHFVAGSGRAEPLLMMLHQSASDLNELDGSGLTPVMVAAESDHVDIFRLLVMKGADITIRSTEGKSVMSIIREKSSQTRDCFEQILLQASLANALTCQTEFRPLNYAARIGDTSSLLQLLKMGHDPNALDEDGYTPLMHATASGSLDSCKILVSHGGADCSLMNERNETALSLARMSSRSSKAMDEWLLDHLSRAHVLAGEELTKHTREGKGSPHRKTVRMMKSGVLTWGSTRRRNVACKEARMGPSVSFTKNRRIVDASARQLIFLVKTVTGREVHFETSSASSVEFWVRGINLILKESA
jgi:ankyrin repeat protein